jgi:hypothetical protein
MKIIGKGLLVGLFLNIFISILAPIRNGIAAITSDALEGFMMFLAAPILNIAYGMIVFIFFFVPCMVGGIAMVYLIEKRKSRNSLSWLIIGSCVYLIGIVPMIIISMGEFFWVELVVYIITLFAFRISWKFLINRQEIP